MKQIFYIPAILLLPTLAEAQLFVGGGAFIKTTSGSVITLQDINLVNNGTIDQLPGEGRFLFTGMGNDTLSGTAALSTFDTLEIAKSGDARLFLQQPVNINSAIRFTSGIIDLSGKTVELESGAMLVDESETSRITDTLLGGYIHTTVPLNAPSSANPGNLGAVISSAADLGETYIARRHAGSIVNGTETPATVFRQYEILPANDAGLNATLRINYFDAETNSLDEAGLTFWKSGSYPYTSFTDEGTTTGDALGNYAELTGINDFSLWVLAGTGGPLPLDFISFVSECTGSSVKNTWVTAAESGTDHFNIERSADSRTWQTIGIMKTKNSGGNEYIFTDDKPLEQASFYRIVCVDIDGKRKYSSVNNINCDKNAAMMNLWPNPVKDELFLSTSCTEATVINIKLVDALGRCAVQQESRLRPGYNKVTINTRAIAAGAYWLSVVNSQGTLQSFKVVKQ